MDHICTNLLALNRALLIDLGRGSHARYHTEASLSQLKSRSRRELQRCADYEALLKVVDTSISDWKAKP